MNGLENPHLNDSKYSLLVSAIPLFAEKGLEGATVKDIAEAAGVNVALISYHFGGKEGLYRSVFEFIGKERLTAAERVLQTPTSQEDLRKKIRLFIEEFFLCYLQNPDVMKIIHRDFDGAHPQALEAFKGVVLEMFMRVKNFLAVAQEQKLIRKELDLDVCVSLMLAGISQCTRMDFLRKEILGVTLSNPEYLTHFVGQFVGVLCDGICAQ